MQLDQFAQNAPGRLVKARHTATPQYPASDYTAFIPHPLPPALSMDTALVRALSDADRALGELAGLGRAVPSPSLLSGPFVRREAVLSSKIEGTQTEIADLYAYEAGQAYLPGLRPPPPVDDMQDVLNYWLLFFLRGVTEQSRDAARRAKQLQDLQSTWREQVAAVTDSGLPLRVIDHLFQRPILTVRDVQDVLGVKSYHTAQKYVQVLNDVGILTLRAEQPVKRYEATAILDCLI